MLLAETAVPVAYLEEGFLIKKVMNELSGQLTGTTIIFGPSLIRSGDISRYSAAKRKGFATKKTVLMGLGIGYDD